MNGNGLTPDDYDKLRALAENGYHGYHAAQPDPADGDMDGQDGRGITLEMCNAIRAAAEDGHTYRYIADLFSFINAPKAVNLHATGRCSHGAVDYPPVQPARQPGPVNPVNRAECDELRRLYDDGASFNDLSDVTGRSVSTVYRHVAENCSHD